MHRQPPGTTPSCLNVRAFDPRAGRYRGGQRAGLTKYISDTATAINGTNPIQDMNFLVTASDSTGRTITRLAVSGGSVYTFTTLAAGKVLTTGGGSALVTTVFAVQSADAFGTMYYVDGTNYKSFTGSTTSTWTSSNGGTLPSSGGTARLICLWRGRIVLSGVAGDAHNWFMSAIEDPLDFNYSPATPTEGDAVAGNNSNAGKIGDRVTALIPFSDEILLVGGDHSIWQINGDPLAGGRADLVSDTTGMAFGRAWAKDAAGMIYFWGGRGGVYRMAPSGQPELISTALLDRFRSVNTANKRIQMAWSVPENGLHVFISPSTAVATTHYFWDAAGNSWWPDSFDTTDHDPTSICVFDGDDPDDRAILLGCRDSYIRTWDLDASDDDDKPIESSVYIGPIRAGDRMSECVLHELQAVLADTSGDVVYSVYKGETVEAAYLAATPVFQGVWSAGKSHSERRRARGEALWLKISNDRKDVTWALESLAARIAAVGRSGQRSLGR